MADLSSKPKLNTDELRSLLRTYPAWDTAYAATVMDFLGYVDLTVPPDETTADARDGEIKRLNELVADHEEVHRNLREILARFNSEDTRVMARRAIERIEDLESDCTRLHKQFMEAKYGPESPVKAAAECTLPHDHFGACNSEKTSGESP
jgi:hypothetical protein